MPTPASLRQARYLHRALIASVHPDWHRLDNATVWRDDTGALHLLENPEHSRMAAVVDNPDAGLTHYAPKTTAPAPTPAVVHTNQAAWLADHPDFQHIPDEYPVAIRRDGQHIAVVADESGRVTTFTRDQETTT